MDISKELQIQRLKVRNPMKLDDFKNIWIPREESYFDICKIRENCDLTLSDEWFAGIFPANSMIYRLKVCWIRLPNPLWYNAERSAFWPDSMCKSGIIMWYKKQNYNFFRTCLRYIHAINVTIISIAGKAIHTPATWKIFPKIYAAGMRMITCLAAEIIMLGVPIESPCNA